VRSQRSSVAETGICGTICSPISRIRSTVACAGAVPLSAKETWTPVRDSSAAMLVICAAGVVTMIPTAL
jgi:hypothetical protein